MIKSIYTIGKKEVKNMRNNNFMKSLAVIALVLSVVGVSLGFAAYSNSLQIKATADYKAPVTPGEAITELSTTSGTVTAGSVTPAVTGATAGNATLTSTSIQNLSVHFTATNQRAVYTFYAVNPSSFVSYLNSVTFGTKSCSPYSAPTNPNPGTASYVANACNDIIMEVEVGSGDFTETQANIDNEN